MSKANWPILNTLSLQNNMIKSEGVKELGRSNWPLMKIIRLGKYTMIRWKLD